MRLEIELNLSKMSQIRTKKKNEIRNIAKSFKNEPNKNEEKK